MSCPRRSMAVVNNMIQLKLIFDYTIYVCCVCTSVYWFWFNFWEQSYANLHEWRFVSNWRSILTDLINLQQSFISNSLVFTGCILMHITGPVECSCRRVQDAIIICRYQLKSVRTLNSWDIDEKDNVLDPHPSVDSFHCLLTMEELYHFIP